MHCRNFHSRVTAILSLVLVVPSLVFAATAEQWRGRSIYQIITDRYALASGADLNACDPGEQTWCGGNWNTIRENLDYIQNAGFTAIWISPINQNYEGSRTTYGDPYHGYWIQDHRKLNDKFGTADDLTALVTELHKRDMYIMIDVVVNNVMATSTKPDYSPYMFNDASLYHPYCEIDWSNTTSEELCWLGDTKVALPDLNTRDATVVETYGEWIQDLVQTYNIDGLRIDAAKHVNIEFWPPFCAKAGVFCIGEVFGGLDVESAAMYQGPSALDSVLNFPMYTALKQAFVIPGPGNVTAISDTLAESKKQFKDMTLLGNFLENQDLPRWANMSVDIQSLFNAMTFNFLSDGIPIVYYGQEQSFHGAGDPYNREPLWPSSYQKTPAYDLMAQLNQLRNFLVNTTDWATQPTEVLTVSQFGIAIIKGDVISVLTNIGSPPQNGTQIGLRSPYEASTAMVNVLTCQQWAVGSAGYLDVEYTKGGRPVVLVPTSVLAGSGICGDVVGGQSSTTGKIVSSSNGSGRSLTTVEWLMGAVVGFAMLLGGW